MINPDFFKNSQVLIYDLKKYEWQKLYCLLGEFTYSVPNTRIKDSIPTHTIQSLNI